MTRLVNIAAIAARAEALGFRVRTAHFGDGQVQVEIFAPEHTGPDAVWSGDSLYSAADFIISDGPGYGYGYNSMFFGPWHFGHCLPDQFGLAELRAHPLFNEQAA